MSRENVSHRVKLSINSLTVAGLIATFVLVTATAALGGIHLPGQQPTPEFTPSHDYVFHDQYDLYAFNTIRPKLLDEGRSYFFPPPPPKPKPVTSAPVRYSGGCYWEPGTPPASVLQRESGGNPHIYNRSGSGASGCWQFMPGTWGGYKGYANAADAPPSVQNERAKQVWNGGKGCGHWRQTTSQC